MRRLVWLPVGGLAVWAAVRAFGLERGFPLVPLMAFTPYALLGGVVVVLLVAATRQRAATLLAVLSVLVLAVNVLPRGLGGPDGGTGGRPLRLLSANVYLGRVPAEPLVDLVRRHDVDVLALQELTPGLREDLRRAGLHRLLPRFGSGAGPLGHGNAIYTRLPGALRALPTPTLNPLVSLRVRWPGAGAVEIVCVHPPPPTSQRLGRWRDDLRRLPRAGGRTSRILAGDFNATLDHAEFRDLLASGYRDAAAEAGEGWTPTWPYRRRLQPNVTIDHVVADERWSVRHVSIHALPRGDHRAVLAELAPVP